MDLSLLVSGGVSEYKDDRTDVLNFYYRNTVIAQGHFNLQHWLFIKSIEF